MKKITFLLIAFILLTTSIPTFAMNSRLNDGADLLTSSEEDLIISTLDTVNQSYGFDLVIVTTNDTDGKSVMEYADDYYDSNGYGKDGILLLVDMGGREWWISTAGKGIDYFSDSTLDYIGSEMAYYLGGGYYLEAFQCFISLTESYISMGEEGYDTNYDYDYGYDSNFGVDSDFTYESEYSFGTTLIVSLIAGFIIALIYVSSLKAKLTSVGAQKEASNYAVNNSLQIAATSDNFLYRNVSRVPRPKSNSSSHSGRSGGSHSVHRSSSGRSHGGRGGRF